MFKTLVVYLKTMCHVLDMGAGGKVGRKERGHVARR
ncbi:MAG: hypothetical protein H6R18_2066 [Proteobacteria bacterium]|nr:hypothetical protein [Pseudomonadota bacterium]